MDKFAERKKFTSCKLVAAAAVAMCLLGSAGFEANAAPAPQVVSAQKATLTISGTVKDSKGEPVIGANVMEKGTNRGIVTDLDGKFTLKVTPGATITVSYLGYKTQTLKAAPTMNVSLEEDNALLDEVVVVLVLRNVPTLQELWQQSMCRRQWTHVQWAMLPKPFKVLFLV